MEAYEALRQQMITHGTWSHSWGAVVLLRSGMPAWIDACQQRAAARQALSRAQPTPPLDPDHAAVINVVVMMALAHCGGGA